MDLFENVKVEKNANVYFDGKVTSRNIFFTDGTKKTLGVMLPGTYEFGTEKKECDLYVIILSVLFKCLCDFESQCGILIHFRFLNIVVKVHVSIAVSAYCLITTFLIKA